MENKAENITVLLWKRITQAQVEYFVLNTILSLFKGIQVRGDISEESNKDDRKL